MDERERDEEAGGARGDVVAADAADAAVDGPGAGGGYEEVADAAGGDPADFDPTSAGDGGEVF